VEPHIDWDDLPADVREAVEKQTGSAIVSAETVPDGITCRTALILETADGDRLFMKGVPVADFDGMAGQITEAAIRESVQAVSPPMRWETIASDWHVIAFEFVDGRHADLSPGSADIEAVADVLRLAQSCNLRNYRVQRWTDRYRKYLRAGDTDWLAGATLLHTDTNPHNLMITDTRAYLIDWAMPAIGPKFVDFAQTAVRLQEAGCSGAQARAWLAQFPEWVHARQEARERFVKVICRHWSATVGPIDAQTSNERFWALLSEE